MGNLGGYQILTTVAKKLGGPGRLVAVTMAGGYVVFRIAEAAGKTIYQKVKEIRTERIERIKTYTVITDATDQQGLVFKKGDRFNVLESDGDAILIELIGNKNNPYFVSKEFLKDISDFKESEFDK